MNDKKRKSKSEPIPPIDTEVAIHAFMSKPAKKQHWVKWELYEQVSDDNHKLQAEIEGLNKTMRNLQIKCELQRAENAELKKELNEVGRKWLNDFSRQDTLITKLEARWEELKEIEHAHRTIEGNQWISLGLLKRRMQELESGGEVPHDKLGAELTNWEAALSVSGTPKPEREKKVK